MLYYNVIYSTVKEIEESDSELTGALWCPNYWTFHKRYMASRSITKYSVTIRDAGTRKGPGGQNLLKGTDKILIMLKSIPCNLEGQLHSSCAKFLPIIFLA